MIWHQCVNGESSTPHRTVASQQEGPGFNSAHWPFCVGVCVFSLSLRGWLVTPRCPSVWAVVRLSVRPAIDWRPIQAVTVSPLMLAGIDCSPLQPSKRLWRWWQDNKSNCWNVHAVIFSIELMKWVILPLHIVFVVASKTQFSQSTSMLRNKPRQWLPF